MGSEMCIRDSPAVDGLDLDACAVAGTPSIPLPLGGSPNRVIYNGAIGDRTFFPQRTKVWFLQKDLSKLL